MKRGEPFNPYKLFTGIYIPEALVRHGGVGPGAKLLYGCLCRYAGADGQCFPSIETLASDLGRKGRQVQDYLRQLEDACLVRRLAEPGKRNKFLFLWHAIFETEPTPPQESAPPQDSAPVQESAERGAENCGGGVQFPASPYRKKRVNKRVSKENHSFDVWFTELWALYPRKVARVAALKAARTAGSSTEERAAILAGLQAHLPELLSRETRFVPHLATWLNQRRWEDAPEAPKGDNAHLDRHAEHDRKVSEAFDSLIAGRLQDGRQIQ
jgi:hypothetical protein